MSQELQERKELLDEHGIKRAVTRITHEILERNKGVEELALVGIHTRGVFLAQRIAALIKELESREVLQGMVDITLYRDDVFLGLPQPIVHGTSISFDPAGKTIVLVDDVLYTGRTVRAAIEAIMDFGRPRAIWLAVLVDRGHRELPIAADFVGMTLQTEKNQSIKVLLKDTDSMEKVVLREKKEESDR